MLQLESFSVPAFCEAYGISQPFFYKLQKEKKGPVSYKVGARRLISRRAAEEWVRYMESQSLEAAA